MARAGRTTHCSFIDVSIVHESSTSRWALERASHATQVGALLRFDGSTWTTVDAPADVNPVRLHQPAFMNGVILRKTFDLKNQSPRFFTFDEKGWSEVLGESGDDIGWSAAGEAFIVFDDAIRRVPWP